MTIKSISFAIFTGVLFTLSGSIMALDLVCDGSMCRIAAPEQSPEDPIITVTTLEELNKIIAETEKLIVVKVSLSAEQQHLCQPCALMAPVFKNLAKKLHNQITFIEIPVDKIPEEQKTTFGAALQISGVPTIMCIKSGQLLFKIAGYPTHVDTDGSFLEPDVVEQMFEKHLQKIADSFQTPDLEKTAEDTPAEITTPPITLITTKEEFDRILQNENLVVIKISTPYCPPCIKMDPIFKNLAEKFGNIMTFAEIYTNECAKDLLFHLATQVKILQAPTILFYKNGVRISKIAGYPVTKNKDYLEHEEAEALLTDHLEALLEGRKPFLAKDEPTLVIDSH